MLESGKVGRNETSKKGNNVNKPKITREEAVKHFEQHLPNDFDFEKYPLYRLSIRGYYKKSVGDPSANDLGVYDDCICLIGKDHFSAYNANTDPSKQLRGSGSKKGTAMLVPGLYYSQSYDLHQNRYPALCQRNGNMKVYRLKSDGSQWIDEGSFGINCHCGGKISTNSEGCETILPIQYAEFIYNVHLHVGELGWTKQVVPNLLIEN